MILLGGGRLRVTQIPFSRPSPSDRTDSLEPTSDKKRKPKLRRGQSSTANVRFTLFQVRSKHSTCCSRTEGQEKISVQIASLTSQAKETKQEVQEGGAVQYNKTRADDDAGGRESRPRAFEGAGLAVYHTLRAACLLACLLVHGVKLSVDRVSRRSWSASDNKQHTRKELHDAMLWFSSARDCFPAHPPPLFTHPPTSNNFTGGGPLLVRWAGRSQ